MLRKLGFMTRCVLQDCIIAAVFHHRSAVIRNTTFPYNGLAARRALYEFAANDLPSSFRKCWRLRNPHHGTVFRRGRDTEALACHAAPEACCRSAELSLPCQKAHSGPPRFIAASFVVTLALSSRQGLN